MLLKYCDLLRKTICSVCLVAQVGGTRWWHTLVAHVGGTRWWNKLVARHTWWHKLSLGMRRQLMPPKVTYVTKLVPPLVPPTCATNMCHQPL